MSIEKPAFKGLRRANKAKWLKPEIRVMARHLKPWGGQKVRKAGRQASPLQI
jgi:hypothetical protein